MSLYRNRRGFKGAGTAREPVSSGVFPLFLRPAGEGSQTEKNQGSKFTAEDGGEIRSRVVSVLLQCHKERGAKWSSGLWLTEG